MSGRWQVAAVIVRDKRIISTGYNGTPRGISGSGPAERAVMPDDCAGCALQATCLQLSAASGTAMLWRRLGLVDPAGVPTRRGRVASFFSQGDGLAIAAGLEDDRDLVPLGADAAQALRDLGGLGQHAAQDSPHLVGQPRDVFGRLLHPSLPVSSIMTTRAESCQAPRSRAPC